MFPGRILRLERRGEGSSPSAQIFKSETKESTKMKIKKGSLVVHQRLQTRRESLCFILEAKRLPESIGVLLYDFERRCCKTIVFNTSTFVDSHFFIRDSFDDLSLVSSF